MNLLRSLALGLSVLALSLGLGGCGVADGFDGGDEDEDLGVDEGAINATSKKQLQYIVLAHPDDELASWSLVERSSDNYPVFILLTQGEETRQCTPGAERSYQPALGEARPYGNPYQGKWTNACKEARVRSWHGFLDAMAGFDPTLSSPTYRGRFTASGSAGGQAPHRDDDGRVVESRSFRVWADSVSARVVFDLGDGDLRPEEVTWAIQTVRSRRTQLFPRIKEYGVIAGSYRNTDPRCDVYDHPDHRAVHVASFGTDQGTPGPQWGRTCIHDPDVANGGRINEVDADVFQYAMGVRAPAIDPERYPNAERIGVFQKHYGWLTDAYWAADESGTSHFGRRQAFWRRF